MGLRARLAQSTCRTRLMALRTFYKGKRDPTAGIIIKEEKKLPPPPYTDGELRRLINACENARDRALLLIYIGSGGRRSEILGLQVNDIDFGRGVIYIHGKGAKQRALAPGAAAMMALQQYVRGDGPVWRSRQGGGIKKTRAWQLLREIAKRANVPKSYLHRFRHTYAGAFLTQSRDLYALKLTLGHSSWDMVERYVAYQAHERALTQQRELSLADRVAG
jgi:integrase